SHQRGPKGMHPPVGTRPSGVALHDQSVLQDGIINAPPLGPIQAIMGVRKLLVFGVPGSRCVGARARPDCSLRTPQYDSPLAAPGSHPPKPWSYTTIPFCGDP